MRIVHTFTYNGGKSFQVGELTVGDYYLFLRDPEYATLKILTEINKTPPKLTASQLNKFLSIYFDGSSDGVEALKNKMKTAGNSKEKMQEQEREFHLQYCIVSKTIGFDCKDLPMEVYKRILQDLAIITGKEKYDKNRHSTKPDKKAIRQLDGASGVLFGK